MSPSFGITVQPATNDDRDSSPAMSKPIIATEDSDEEGMKESHPESRAESVQVDDDRKRESEGESTAALQSVPAAESISLERKDVVTRDSDQIDQPQRAAALMSLPEPCISGKRSKKKEKKRYIPKRVAFHQVIVRHYEQTLGDNPAVSYGPPIQLDWEYEQQRPQDICMYESNRGKRRSMRMLILSHYQRTNILCWNYGIPADVVKSAQLQADADKRRRSRTVMFLPLSGVEGIIQAFTRKLRCLKCTSTSVES